MCQFYFKTKDHRHWQCPSRVNVVYSNHVSCIREPIWTAANAAKDALWCRHINAFVHKRWCLEKEKNAVWHLQLFTQDQVCVRARHLVVLWRAQTASSVWFELFGFSSVLLPVMRARLRLRHSSSAILLVKKSRPLTQTPEQSSLSTGCSCTRITCIPHCTLWSFSNKNNAFLGLLQNFFNLTFLTVTR